MTNRSQNENNYKGANHGIKKLEFLSYANRYDSNPLNRGIKQAEVASRIIKAVQQRRAGLVKDFLIAEASAN